MKIILVYIMLCITLNLGFSDNMNSLSKRLPDTINNWHRSGEVQIIDTTNIFDYMDGGAELYLGYKFNHLEVLEYQSEDKNTILVEIYHMDTSDDAFGLLSLDWSGEPVAYNDQIKLENCLAPSVRALYGSGLLRLATGNHYIRIMAFRETVDAKKIVIDIGERLYKDFVSEPEIVHHIPSLESIGWEMNTENIALFRSYMVLNSLFYLSHQNILNLDHSVNAVTVSYDSKNKDNKNKPIQLLITEYTSHQQAVDALNSFFKYFLPESKTVIDISESKFIKSVEIEEGWLACKMEKNLVSLVFNIPDKSSAEQITNHIKLNNTNGE